MPIDKAFLKPIQIFARDRAKLFRRFPQLPEKIEQIRHEVFDHYMFPAEKGYKSHATQLKHIYINQFNPPNIMKFGRKVRTVLPKKQQQSELFIPKPNTKYAYNLMIDSFCFLLFSGGTRTLDGTRATTKRKECHFETTGRRETQKGCQSRQQKEEIIINLSLQLQTILLMRIIGSTREIWQCAWVIFGVVIAITWAWTLPPQLSTPDCTIDSVVRVRRVVLPRLPRVV